MGNLFAWAGVIAEARLFLASRWKVCASILLFFVLGCPSMLWVVRASLFYFHVLPVYMADVVVPILPHLRQGPETLGARLG